MHQNEELNCKTTPYYFPCPKKRGRYQNPYIEDSKRRLWDFFLWQVGQYDQENFRPLAPKDFSYPNPKQQLDTNLTRCFWVKPSNFYVN